MKPIRPRPTHRRRTARTSRRGSVLIIVLVVILLLTYGVYGFTERMLAERRAADAYGRTVQANAFAESGIEFAASVITNRAADPANPTPLYHEPAMFSGVVMNESPSPAAVGRFTLVAPVEGDPTFQQVRYGLVDESGKLNLNAIAAMELDDAQQNFLLYSIPGMTEEIADAILDYIDEDETIRLLGAESEYYSTLLPPYTSKNAPLESLDELLQVRGVTPELLYGEDANRNGLLDPSEDDGAASPPLDNADGVLHPGWQAYLTVHSRESNNRPDGTPKIYINQGLLTDLYDQIMEELDDEEAARFIVAYRMYGPNDGVVDDTSTSNTQSDTSGPDEPGSATDSPGEAGGENRSSSNSPTQGDANRVDGIAQRLGNLLAGVNDDSVTRGGLDLSKGPQFEIKSLYALIDRAVDVPENAEAGTSAETIVSPWTTSTLLTDYPFLFDNFALTETAVLEGRVNVNEARYETLLGLPGMTPQIADAIMASRVGPSGEALSETPDRRTTAWLVSQGIVDLPTMRSLDRYLTGRGDVFRVQSVGYYDGGGPAARIEAIIDGSVTPAKIVQFRDLSELGRGYPPSKLLPNGGQTGL